jgi:hypothetical protein
MPPDLEAKLDAWIEAQSEPKPSKSERSGGCWRGRWGIGLKINLWTLARGEASLMTKFSQIDTATVVARLEALYQRRKKLDRQRARADKPISVIGPGEIDLDEVLKPALEVALEQPRDAINYMTWLIGETLHACGGMPLLREVEKGFYEGHEREFQSRASFLNARWDGIGDWHA